MKALGVAYDEEEQPATFDVRLTLKELALIYRLTAMAPNLAVTNAAGGDYTFGEANGELAQGIGSLLNTFYEAGVDDVAPRFGAVEVAAAYAEIRTVKEA